MKKSSRSRTSHTATLPSLADQQIHEVRGGDGTPGTLEPTTTTSTGGPLIGDEARAHVILHG